MIRHITVKKILLLGCLSFLFGCPTPTIEPVNLEELEKLKQQQDSGVVIEETVDAGTATPTNTTDAGTANPTNTADAGTANPTNTADAGGESQTSATDAGTENLTNTTDAGSENPVSTTDAGFSCPPCEHGFTHITGTCTCVDINECHTDNGGCDTNASCTNAVNSGEAPICTCNFGYEGDGENCDFQCDEGASCLNLSTAMMMGTTSGYCSNYDGQVSCGFFPESCSEGDVCMQVNAGMAYCVRPCGRKIYADIGVATDFVCGVQDGASGVDCVGNIDPSKYASLLDNYSEISCHGKTCCALSITRQISCFTSDASLPEWASDTNLSNLLDDGPASINDLSMSDNHGCLRIGFNGLCWGEADYCGVNNLNCGTDNCSLAEVPCEEHSGVFLHPEFDGETELYKIKTSRTNTCGILDKTGDDDPHFIRCKGQTGWGLGGESDVTSIEDKAKFPFFNSTNEMQEGFNYNGTNFTINDISDIAFDEKRICILASLASVENALSHQIICAGRPDFNSILMDVTMLEGAYESFEVSGAWGCGQTLEGGISCTDLTDLTNLASSTDMFPGASVPVKNMAMSDNSICAIDSSKKVLCTALPGMNTQNFHLETLGL